jgi:[ribosomal protein S5]-alanine N-acetyltransferase
VGRHALLARPRPDDEVEFLARVAASRDLHMPWVSPPANSEAYRAYLRRLRQHDQTGFLVRDRESDGLAGVINVGNVVLGSFRSAYLGYYAFMPLAGRGYMAEGLVLAVDYAFAALGLHRVEANVQPANTRSIALVKRLGFRLEGLSPRYLMIDGDWRDHERWAVTIEEWDPPR